MPLWVGLQPDKLWVGLQPDKGSAPVWVGLQPDKGSAYAEPAEAGIKVLVGMNAYPH